MSTETGIHPDEFAVFGDFAADYRRSYERQLAATLLDAQMEVNSWVKEQTREASVAMRQAQRKDRAYYTSKGWQTVGLDHSRERCTPDELRQRAATLDAEAVKHQGTGGGVRRKAQAQFLRKIADKLDARWSQEHDKVIREWRQEISYRAGQQRPGQGRPSSTAG